MKLNIDPITTLAYAALSVAYLSHPDPNLWVYGFLLLCALAIDVRSYRRGLDKGGEIMQEVMKQTLKDGNWTITRK
jgi:hypothetical protein